MLRTIFDKKDLLLIENSLEKEYLITSSSGAYSSSSISGCNTRKYHGLLVVPQPGIDNENHVLLSCLDETVHFEDKSFKLSTHKYPGAIYPDGKQFIEEFVATPLPSWLYRLDEVLLSREILLSEKNMTLMVRYTLLEAESPVRMSLYPLLAFRNISTLSKSNWLLNTTNLKISNGIKLSPYQNYKPLFLQLSVKNQFIPKPDWNYNLEYLADIEKGDEYLEDLYNPGYFEFTMNKGAEVIFSASLVDMKPEKLPSEFKKAKLATRIVQTMDDCLKNAANEFIINKGQDFSVRKGFPGSEGCNMSAFIALPGLTLVQRKANVFKAVIGSCLKNLDQGKFQNAADSTDDGNRPAETALWFIWAIHQYAIYNNAWDDVWGEYGNEIRSILDNLKNDAEGKFGLGNDGLIWQFTTDQPYESLVGSNGHIKMVKTVETNALWYNAVCFAIEAAYLGDDKVFFNAWEDMPAKIKSGFMTAFWDEEKGYLADRVYQKSVDWTVRPYQVFAVSMPFSPVPIVRRYDILEKIKSELLSNRGLRTLSPYDHRYIGECKNDTEDKKMPFRNGSALPWLATHFCEAYLHEFGEEGLPFCEHIYTEFESALNESCLFHIAEAYDGSAPHHAGGGISSAVNTGELIRLKAVIAKVREAAKSAVKHEQA